MLLVGYPELILRVPCMNEGRRKALPRRSITTDSAIHMHYQAKGRSFERIWRNMKGYGIRSWLRWSPFIQRVLTETSFYYVYAVTFTGRLMLSRICDWNTGLFLVLDTRATSRLTTNGHVSGFFPLCSPRQTGYRAAAEMWYQELAKAISLLSESSHGRKLFDSNIAMFLAYWLLAVYVGGNPNAPIEMPVFH